MAGGEGEGVHCPSTGRCRADDTVDGCRRDSFLGPYVRWAMAFPRARTVAMESSASPPSVSATMGTNSIRTALQADRWAVSLRWIPTCGAWPGE